MVMGLGVGMEDSKELRGLRDLDSNLTTPPLAESFL